MTTTETRVLTAKPLPTPAQWQRAARRAVDEGIEVRYMPHWDVWVAWRPGSENAYRVRLVDGEVACECTAASYGNACKHAAALRMRRGELALAVDEEQA